jgi:hypothetical protein
MTEECQLLINQITDYATSSVDRSHAETRLNQIMTLTSFWQNNLTCLQSVNDTLLFFMCQGLQKYIWKHWFEFPSNEQELISNVIMTTLFQRSTTLSNYARSKLEQLLGTVCTLSTSLDPVLKIASATSNPNETGSNNLIVGVSALKTILDDVLTSNPRIPPEKFKQLLQIAESNAIAITQLAYQSTLLGINEGGDSPLLYFSLELIKTILCKLPVGGHISMDLLILLFNIAENMFLSSHRVAIVAIEALTELMGKSYLPPNVGSSNILNELVLKAVALLRFVKASCTDGLNDNPVILALLEFLYMFTESHLERYLQSSYTSNNINSFLAEIATVTCAISDPNTLKKVALVWESLLGIELVWPLIGSLSSTVTLPVVNHLLHNCLFSKNILLLEAVQDIEDGLQTEPFVDPHIREIVSHLEIYYSSNKGNLDSPIDNNSLLEGVEEITSVAVAVRQGTTKLIQQFVAYSGSDVTSFLCSMLPPMTQEFLLGMSSSNGDIAINFALDLYFILPLLPLCVEHSMLSCHLSNIILQLVTERVQTKGTAYVSVVVCTCHIMESLMKSMSNTSSMNDSLMQCMNNIIQSCIVASDTTISPYPISITGSLFSLLLQSLMSLLKLLRIGSDISPFAKVISEQLYVSVLPKLNVLPIEIQALLLCILDLLVPNDISVKYIEQFRDIAGLCVSSSTSITDNSQIFLISRVTASVDAFAKFHSISNSVERTRVISILNPLKDYLTPILKSLLHNVESSVGVSNVSIKGSLLVAARFIISLSCALLQCLGKKTFGSQANEILELCVSFFDNSSGNSIGIRMLQDGTGFPLIKQIFTLVSVIATTSGATSTSAAFQVHLSHRLIESISSTLADQRICAELLQDLLKAGSIITKTYWYNTASTAGQTYSLQPTIELLVQLCVGCMDSSVSPQDALIAIEGILALSKQHNLFTLPWFQQGSSWGILIRSCLKAIMLKTHSIHADAIFMLLSDLSQAKISTDNTNNFWSFLGTEVINFAIEFQCGDFANILIQTLAKEIELDGRKIIDINMFQQKILLPISCEIARIRE